VSDARLLHALGATPAGGLGELFVRHARKDGRSVAILRAVDDGAGVVVECQVFPRGGEAAATPDIRFGDAQQALAFAHETVEALMYLGCDVHTQ
jgi:hypothetical protein